MLNNIILLNGTVYTLDSRNSVAEAVFVKNGRIAMTGSSEMINRSVDSTVKRIDLRGKAVFPGFIDCHTHLDLYGMMTSDYVVNCRIPPLMNVDEILKRIKEKTDSLPEGKLILAQAGWSQPIPSKTQLDDVAPNHPIIMKTNMHVMYANSCALNKFNITSDRPTIQELFNIGIRGKIRRDAATGDPSGYLYDVWNYLFPNSRSPFSYDETKEMIKKALTKYSSFGVTTVTEFYNTQESMSIYQELHQCGELNIRLHIVPCVHGIYKTVNVESIFELALKTGFGNKWIQFAGIKIFLDALTDITLTSIELDEIVMRAHRAGIRVFIHALTRKSQDMALEAIESAVADCPDKDLRHRIEHMGNRLYDIEYFDRVKKVKAIALPTAYLINIGWSNPKGLKTQLFRTMLDYGLCVPGSSDSAGSIPDGPNPLYQIWCMVERKSKEGKILCPDERLSPLEAIQVYTRHSAYACHEEQIKGSIENGKLADLVVLDMDPLKSPIDKIKDIKVETTIVGGKIVYEASK